MFRFEFEKISCLIVNYKDFVYGYGIYLRFEYLINEKFVFCVVCKEKYLFVYVVFCIYFFQDFRLNWKKGVGIQEVDGDKVIVLDYMFYRLGSWDWNFGLLIF